MTSLQREVNLGVSLSLPDVRAVRADPTTGAVFAERTLPLGSTRLGAVADQVSSLIGVLEVHAAKIGMAIKAFGPAVIPPHTACSLQAALAAAKRRDPVLGSHPAARVAALNAQVPHLRYVICDVEETVVTLAIGNSGERTTHHQADLGDLLANVAGLAGEAGIAPEFAAVAGAAPEVDEVRAQLAEALSLPEVIPAKSDTLAAIGAAILAAQPLVSAELAQGRRNAPQRWMAAALVTVGALGIAAAATLDASSPDSGPETTSVAQGQVATNTQKQGEAPSKVHSTTPELDNSTYLALIAAPGVQRSTAASGNVATLPGPRRPTTANPAATRDVPATTEASQESDPAATEETGSEALTALEPTTFEEPNAKVSGP